MAYIEFKDIHKYFGSAHVLKGINLGVEYGQMVTLLGPSGCGKSTLLRCLAGLEHVDQGQIFLDGNDITHLTPKQRNIGMVFQQYSLFPTMTVRQNVAFGLQIQKVEKSKIDAKVKEVLEIVGLSDKIDHYPRQLSGGQQQRTAIGRAIVKNPDILLCDEPTGALDYNTSKEILKLIETVNQKYGNTVVMVTHNDAIKDMADRVVKLRDGMIRKNYQNEHKIPAMDLDW